MKKLLLLVPLLLFAINKEFEKKYLSNVKMYESEINQSGLLKQNINIGKIQLDLNRTLKGIKFQKPNNKNASLQAKKLNDYLHGKKYQKNIQEMRQYILYDKDINFSKYIPKGFSAKFLKRHKYLANDEAIYIVISSSMPISTIQNYFKTVQPVSEDITFVLRGLVGNDLKHIKPTLKWMNKVLTINPYKKTSKNNRYRVNLAINPKVTEHFGITEVPAVIFVKNYNGFLDKYEPLPKGNTGEEAYIAYGDANLIYTLERINKKAKSKTLGRLIKKMRGGFF